MSFSPVHLLPERGSYQALMYKNLAPYAKSKHGRLRQRFADFLSATNARKLKSGLHTFVTIENMLAIMFLKRVLKLSTYRI